MEKTVNAYNEKISTVMSAEELRKAIQILSPSMNDYLYLFDIENDFYSLSPNVVERFCVPSCEFHNVKDALSQFVYAEDIPLLQADIDEIMTTDRTSHDLLYRWLSTDGKPIWINCRGTVVRRDGKPIYMAGCINEVGRAQQADNRSGLLGTFELRKHVEQYLPDLPSGFFLRIGMDDMKGIVARFGMEYGDQLTAATATFIVQSCNADQHVYRLDGDEFMVVDFSGGTSEDARKLYNNVQDRIASMLAQTHYKVLLTLSAGVVTCGDLSDPSFASIMRQTNFILSESQKQGQNCFRQYTHEAYARFLKYRNLRMLMISAVEHNFEGFEVYYQPLYSVENRRINSAEALLRFHSEEYGMVPPLDFVPILEETGLIVPVGRWVLREACTACLKLQELIPDFHMSINVSSVQIMRSPFWQDLTTIIQEIGLNPACITCELTESMELEQDSHVMNTSRQIQASKIRLALDDFGTGYSNFRYITDLMPNVIKVDRQFTSKAAVDPFEFKLLSVFSEMAHTLGTELVVEGVENEQELEAAYLVSADYIQGYYFSKPGPFSSIYSMLQEGQSEERSIQFPKLLYDQYFVSDVLTGDIGSLIWVNLENGAFKAMKKRTKLPLPDSTLDQLAEGIVSLGILYPEDEEKLRQFLSLSYVRGRIQEGQTKIAYRLRMKIQKEIKWVLAEITVPTTYSTNFPFVLLTWSKADSAKF